MKEISLDGRCVLLTGASRGIGRCAAVLLSRAGARVAIHYHRSESAARETLAECRAAFADRGTAGEGPAIFRGDMSHPEEIRSLVHRVQKEMGGIHVLVNNAGIYRDNPFDEPDWNRWTQEWRRMIDVNLMGPAHEIWCVLP